MKPVWWMIGGGVLSWLAIASLGVDNNRDVFLGMLAPLAGAIATWMIVARLYPRHPERLTNAMLAAFAAKLVLYGMYVTIMLKWVSVEPLPFVISFTGYFIGLLFFEALCLQRFFAMQMQSFSRNVAGGL